MKLAISNIAWDPAENREVLELMQQHGVTGLEVAPTKVWSKPLEVSAAEAEDYRDWWRERGIQIVATQALLFGQPQWGVFQDATTRRQMVHYLDRILFLSGALGAAVAVFGSPKNRLRGSLDPEQAMAIAVPFFRELGESASSHGVCLGIEPNPPAYGADFVNTCADGVALVTAVDHPGFRLHVDGSAITLNGEDPALTLAASRDWMVHFHISEPQLGLIGEGATDHASLAQALTTQKYGGWKSIEMRSGLRSSNVSAVDLALRCAVAHYSEKEVV